MTNRGNTASACYIPSIIRSSVGYVVFFFLYLCLFSMQSQILSVWLASQKTMPVWNMQRQRVRKISWAVLLVRAWRAHTHIIVFKFKFPVICSLKLSVPCNKRLFHCCKICVCGIKILIFDFRCQRKMNDVRLIYVCLLLELKQQRLEYIICIQSANITRMNLKFGLVVAESSSNETFWVLTDYIKPFILIQHAIW